MELIVDLMQLVEFEVMMVVTLKCRIFWDVTHLVW
jgi:hypothetical protein